MTDLFGNERRPPAASLRPLPSPIRLSLFDAAAESSALRTGRPVSQERAELAGAGLRCLRDHALLKSPATGLLACPVCDA